MLNDTGTIIKGIATAKDHCVDLDIESIGRAIEKYPNARWGDAFSQGQIKSKIWLIQSFVSIKDWSPQRRVIFVLGGWYGILPYLMMSSCFHGDTIRSFDIDEQCEPIADELNLAYVSDDWKFKAVTKDMYLMDYVNCRYRVEKKNGDPVFMTETPTLIINTACEHISEPEYWWDQIPKGMKVVLQSNDYFDWPEHVNCVTDLNHFKNQFPMTRIDYSGSMEFDKYSRFMLIGEK